MDIFHEINQWGKGSVFKYGFLDTLMIMLCFLVCAYLLKRLINRSIKRHVKVNTRFVMRLVKITLYTIAIYGCLSLLTPFESVLGKVWGSAGIIAVVIGFAAQDAMGNFVNGLLITTFKPFKIGDLVKVNQGEYEGYVVDISLRDTVIQTYENTKVIIPNSVINKAVLENVSLNDNTKGNFLELDISYESDMDKAMRIIKEEVMAHPNFLDHRSQDEVTAGVEPVIVRLIRFNDSSITLRTTVYSTSNAEGFALLSDLRIAIKHRFDAEGIDFPYPHRTIITKSQHPNANDDSIETR